MILKLYLLNLILVTVLEIKVNGDSVDYSNEGTTVRNTNKTHIRNLIKHIDRKIFLKPNEILVGEAIHELVGKHDEFSKQVNKFENAYKSYLRMEGVKYSFKRDGYWRTWRPVRYPDDKEHAVFYRCQTSRDNKDDKNADCQNGGFWDIEEKSQECPFEIFSMNNKKYLCGMRYDNVRSQQLCPDELSYDEVKNRCPSPIITRMRFSKQFDKKHFRASPKLVCGGKDACDVTTLYELNNTQILFQIISSNNDIIYSKLMKPNKHNYVCFKNCGNTMGKHLKTIVKKPYSKTKRETKMKKETNSKKNNSKSNNTKIVRRPVSKPKIITKTKKPKKKLNKVLSRSKRNDEKNKVKKKFQPKAKKRKQTRKKITTLIKPHEKTKTKQSNTTQANTTKEAYISTEAYSTKEKYNSTTENNSITEKYTKIEVNTTNTDITTSAVVTTTHKGTTHAKKKATSKNKKDKTPKPNHRTKREIHDRDDKKLKKVTKNKKYSNAKDYKPNHRNRNVMSPEMKKFFNILDIKKRSKYAGEEYKNLKDDIRKYIENHPHYNKSS